MGGGEDPRATPKGPGVSPTRWGCHEGWWGLSCSLPDTLLGDFLLTYTVFMPTSQLCRALLHQYPSVAGLGGSTACTPSLGTSGLSLAPATPVGHQGLAVGTPNPAGTSPFPSHPGG